MWIEKIIVESVNENGKISSVVISDKEGENMLVSERSKFNDSPFGERVPFNVVPEGNYDIISYSGETPESTITRGEINELHIRWLYIPLKQYSAVCYWLSLPPDAVITDVKKISPKDGWNYAIHKDNELRKFWLRCNFSREETTNIDFVIKYKIDSNGFNSDKEREHLSSWKDDINQMLYDDKKGQKTVFKILRMFLGL